MVRREKKVLLHEKVLHYLRKKIINGELKPNESLEEHKIASQLGVSVTPVREALRMLESQGLVDSIPHKGKVVRGFTIKDMVELYEVREALETLAFKKATRNMKEKDKKALSKLIAIMEEKTSIKDLGALHDANVEFDRYIYKLSNNRILQRMLEDLLPLTMRIRVTSLRIPDRIEKIKDEHKSILQAMINGDVKKVEQLVREHIRNSSSHIKKLLGEIKALGM